MPAIIARNATEVILRVELRTSTGEVLEDIAYDDADLSIFYRRPADTSWQEITLAEGTPGTWGEGNWSYIDNGLHELGLPDDAVVMDQNVALIIIYDGHTQKDIISCTAPGEGIFVVPASVVNSVTATPGEAEVYRGTQWEITLTGISNANIADANAIYFGVKDSDDTDANALVQVRLPLNGDLGADGLIRINQQSPATAGLDATYAEIVHTTYMEGMETLNKFVCTIEGEATALIPPTVALQQTNNLTFPTQGTLPSYYAEWKITGDTDLVVSSGLIAVRPDINRYTS